MIPTTANSYAVQRALYAQGRESTTEVNRLRKLAGLPRIQPPTALESVIKGKYKGIELGKTKLFVQVAAQIMWLIVGDQIVQTFKISTAKAGIGTLPGTNTTPPGLHKITEKLGDGAQTGQVFAGRVLQDYKVPIITKPLDSKEDYVITRLMWLSGVESHNKNSHSRFVYIHGTPEEGLLGTPASHGCIRMNNVEIIQLYNILKIGTYVLIDDDTPLQLEVVTNERPVEQPKAIEQLKPKQVGVKADVSPYFVYIHDNPKITTLAGIIEAQGLTDITPQDILETEDNAERIHSALRPEEKLKYKIPTLESFVVRNNIISPLAQGKAELLSAPQGSVDALQPNVITVSQQNKQANNLPPVPALVAITPVGSPAPVVGTDGVEKAQTNSSTGSTNPRAIKIDVIEPGTAILLPHKSVASYKLTADGNRQLVNSTDIPLFLTDALRNMLGEEGYTQAYANKQLGSVSKAMPNVTVWIWCKSLGKVGNRVDDDSQKSIDNTSDDIVGQIFNLTPFIESCNIQVGPTGGTFSLSLPPLTCELAGESWQLKASAIKEFIDTYGNTNYTAKDSIINISENEYRANNFMFHNMVNTNDIVWIRFEPLVNEKDRKIAGPIKSIINKSELPGKNYDMIGLVDRNTLRTDYGRSSVSINISGRDLIKLLIEDGSTWLNIPNLRENEGIFLNANWQKFGRTVRRFDRIGPSNNPLAYYAQFRAPSVGEVCSILFGSVATVEIAPDDLFNAYPRQYDPATGQEGISRYLQFTEGQAKFVPGAGIWSIIKVLIDKTVNDRVLADDSISTFEGSLINGIQKYIQKPFAEMYTDTYKDQFYIVIRKPPTDSVGYLALVDICRNTPALNIEPEHVLSDNLAFDDSEVYCWYRLQAKSVLGGTSNNMDPMTLPIVYFREYNEIWGNRSMDIVSNYLHRENMVTPNTFNEKDASSARKQAEIDLRYMVESNAYTPFTRKGTITIHGDRRIKRGTIIFHKLTGEFYYVDAVANSYQINANSIERVTTLTVSRGMVDKSPSGVNVLELYFNIIATFDTQYDQDKKPVFDWTVQTEVFNYFLKRLQFSNYDFEKTSLNK
jgi:hypothetical protein